MDRPAQSAASSGAWPAPRRGLRTDFLGFRLYEVPISAHPAPRRRLGGEAPGIQRAARLRIARPRLAASPASPLVSRSVSLRFSAFSARPRLRRRLVVPAIRRVEQPMAPAGTTGVSRFLQARSEPSRAAMVPLPMRRAVDGDDQGGSFRRCDIAPGPRINYKPEQARRIMPGSSTTVKASSAARPRTRGSWR